MIFPVFALFGGPWMPVSDRLPVAFVSDPADLTRLQTYKGWFFLVNTS